ncbi:MAG: hypothetical protein HY235_08040 [Acidobacteria bacterium]|nr:hypothetical protein [Acidobacteriota bacterium]
MPGVCRPEKDMWGLTTGGKGCTFVWNRSQEWKFRIRSLCHAASAAHTLSSDSPNRHRRLAGGRARVFAKRFEIVCISLLYFLRALALDHALFVAVLLGASISESYRTKIGKDAQIRASVAFWLVRQVCGMCAGQQR